MINPSFKIFVILVSITFRSFFCNSQLEQDFTFTFSKYVRVSDSTQISIQSENSLSEDYKFYWQTNIGTIQSSGKEVIYYAPDTLGEANIQVEVYRQTEFILRDTLKISIFRQLIILKADDFVYDENKIISDNWTRFLHYVVSEKIKTSVGLLVNSLETADERYFYLLKYLKRTGYIEIWNHGYNHLLGAQNLNGELYDEFRNSTLNYQIEQLRKAQTLAKEKLDITLRTFGAPGNAIDSTTIQALEAFEEIKVWFFGLEGSKKLVLGRGAELEYSTGKPDYNSFVQNYNPNKEYLVFQIHPNQWDEHQFETFKQIIEFLREQRTTFILPFEYYNSIVTQPIN